ncbi:Endonuclease/exonuclease/phosphatase [Spinellus fusiger]|nr:Endonuclease/exonuclease/phosphatase [Spinellus fusiger]
MNRVSIGLWNANGLQQSLVHDIMTHPHSFSMLFITETWLLSPSHLPTPWTQFHTYGKPVADNFCGSMGICALIPPSCSFHVTQLPMPSPYTLGVQFVLLHLPPSLSIEAALEVLNSIPLLDNTIICGNLNACLGSIIGDHDTNPRGTALIDWIEEHQLQVHNIMHAFGLPTFLSFCQEQQLTSIVDLFLSNCVFANPSMEVFDNLSLSSDHKLLSLSFDYDMSSAPPTPPPV